MNPDSDKTARLSLEPIGFVRTDLSSRVEAARQPRAAAGVGGTIELCSGRNFEHALDDLQGWEYIWVIFWFHLNSSWRPKVLPPRSTTGRKGVFSTRSPHRPNPIGLSAVRLERIEGLTLHIRDVDMVDGTPVLDIKPYVAYADAHPGARSGWLDDGCVTAGAGQPADPVAAFDVVFDVVATEQLAWIEARTGMSLRKRIESTLALGPTPHPYRRIRREDDGFRLAIKDWRIRFAVAGRDVHVMQVSSGYRASQLASPGEGEPLAAHREFGAIWPARRDPRPGE